MTHVEAIDATVHKTNRWLASVQHNLGGGATRKAAYSALRAVLHALRDRLTVDQAAHLGAQLPMLVRGIFYEGWHPRGKPLRLRHSEEFLSLVYAGLGRESLDADDTTRAVFRTLEEHVDSGEIDKIISVLPTELRELWGPPVEARDT